MSEANDNPRAAALQSEVHLYCCDPSSFSDGEHLDELGRLLSSEERTRLDAFRFDRDRYYFLASHAMLRLALSEYHDVDPSAWRFTANEHGKPAVADGLPALEFNLSHTLGMCVVAVTRDVRCGIDVEFLNRDSNIDGVAGRMFTDDEISYMHSDPERIKERFFMLWTLRESYLKALGLGLSGNTDSFSFRVDDASGDVGIVYHEGKAGDWGFHLHRPSNQHVLSVCVENGSTRDVVKQDTQGIRSRMCSL